MTASLVSGSLQGLVPLPKTNDFRSLGWGGRTKTAPLPLSRDLDPHCGPPAPIPMSPKLKSFNPRIHNVVDTV